MINCLHCGKEFKPIRKTNIFCSTECRITYWKLKGSYFSYKSVRPYTTISELEYNKLTAKCSVCNADSYIQVHHIDFNPYNDSSDNTIGLCLNCHHFARNKKFKGMKKDLLIPILKEHIQKYYHNKAIKEMFMT